MSDWPVNDSPTSRRSRPAPARKAYSRVAASAGSGVAINARVSTPRQRRRQAETLMEVRLRPGRAAAIRAQRVGLWLSLFLLVAAIGIGGWLAATRGGAWLFWKNPDYDITTVDVETDGVIARDLVLETAEVREGMNIFRLDLDKAKARLETLPQVQRVLVQRQLPNKVSILISERKPVAWIAPDTGAKTREEVFASPKSFLVDAGGVLIRARKVLPQYFGLPIIRHANADRLAPGQVADAENVRAALDLLRAHTDAIVGARFQVDEVDLSRGYGLLVRDRNGLQVLFGLDDPELQLRTLDTVLSAVGNSGRRPATISLMTLEARQRNIPVTFQPDAPPPTPAGVPPPGAEPPSAAEIDAAAAAGAPGVGGANPVNAKDREKKEGNATGKPSKPVPSKEKSPAANVRKPAREKSVAKKEKPAAKPPAPEPTVRKALPVFQPFQ